MLRALALLATLGPAAASSKVTGNTAYNTCASGECICSGSANGKTLLGGVQTGPDSKMNRLKAMYENCSRVIGNLEISSIDIGDLQGFGSADFAFLSNIREVSGYVLISHNQFLNLTLPSLELIRGERGLHQKDGDDGYALSVYNNPNLQFLSMPKLKAIQNLRVELFQNRLLCNWQSIDWATLIQDWSPTRLESKSNYEDCKVYGNSECASNCTQGHCWGPGEDMCQDMYKTGCAAQCQSGQCFAKGGGEESCCQLSCVAGCTGPRTTECVACAHFDNNGSCVDSCPKLELYNKYTYKVEVNPLGRYTYKHLCVAKCPKNMLILAGHCLSQCPSGFHSPDAEKSDPDAGPFECEECQGACPKSCSVAEDEYVDSETLASFSNCTVVQGNIIILLHAFRDSSKMLDDGSIVPTKAITIAQLEALSSVRKVSGYIYVQSHHLQSLSFLRNLEIIEGRRLQSNRYALEISGSERMEHLGLVSLKSIRNGHYPEAFSTSDLYTSPKTRISAMWTPSTGPSFSFRKPSKRKWSTTAQTTFACVSCGKFSLDGSCVESCDGSAGFFSPEAAVCERCDDQCKSCTGRGPSNCTECVAMRQGEACVSECDLESHYAEGRRCFECHPNCFNYGCTGPQSNVGPGGCNKCKIGVLRKEGDKFLECLAEAEKVESLCTTPGFHSHYLVAASSTQWSSDSSVYVCLPCDAACATCSGSGVAVARPSRCACRSHVVETPAGENCALECPIESSFPAEEGPKDTLHRCGMCHEECRDGCRGPHAEDCVDCAHVRLEHDDGMTTCMRNCSPPTPFVFRDVCYSEDMAIVFARQKTHRLVYTLMGVAAALLLLVGLAAACFAYRRKFRTLKQQYTDIDIPESPGYKPNMSRLRIIKQSELRRGAKLGEGAFGAVFQGVYRPDGESVKVPVAIKQLTRSNPDTEKEMLEEATHMGSVSHPHLVRLVGICVSDKILLVTPLMPLGNLRDYIKNNQGRIGSSAMLRWAHQIAMGMEHLEERRLVHRDLAARNVLVRNPAHVAVTDFGLAKMLDYGEKEVFVEGRVPVKWLALESITQRRFTHKSDVWAYGVTLWEILSFGRHPYEDVPIQRIPEILKNGQRLEQPATCSLNLYMLLINCWILESCSRPSFSEIVQRVGEFLKTPSTYVTIPNDKMMRLPSYSDESRRMLEDALFIGDGDLVDATTYFDSSEVAPDSTDVVSPSSPSKPLMWHQSGRIGGAGPSRHSSVGSRRYQSDPLRGLPPHKEEVEAGTSSVSTDADNYLTPNSVMGALGDAPTAYTKVVEGKPGYYNDTAARIPQEGEVGLENPEYLAPSSQLRGEVQESETTV